MKDSTSASLNNTSRALILCRVIFPWSAHRKSVFEQIPRRAATDLALLKLNTEDCGVEFMTFASLPESSATK